MHTTGPPLLSHFALFNLRHRASGFLISNSSPIKNCKTLNQKLFIIPQSNFCFDAYVAISAAPHCLALLGANSLAAASIRGSAGRVPQAGDRTEKVALIQS